MPRFINPRQSQCGEMQQFVCQIEHAEHNQRDSRSLIGILYCYLLSPRSPLLSSIFVKVNRFSHCRLSSLKRLALHSFMPDGNDTESLQLQRHVEYFVHIFVRGHAGCRQNAREAVPSNCPIPYLPPEVAGKWKR
mgnify:CR=1 FL=1